MAVALTRNARFATPSRSAGLVRRLSLTLWLGLLGIPLACTSVPAQVAQLHLKEREILVSLQASHEAMVDSFIDGRIGAFEAMFFGEYGPEFLTAWKRNFKDVYGRDFVEDRDFPLLYNDLVAEYTVQLEPIEAMRTQLRNAIAAEYRSALAAHDTVGTWLDNLEKLSSAQKQSLDGVLGSIKPGLTTETIDQSVTDAITNTQSKLAELVGS